MGTDPGGGRTGRPIGYTPAPTANPASGISLMLMQLRLQAREGGLTHASALALARAAGATALTPLHNLLLALQARPHALNAAPLT